MKKFTFFVLMLLSYWGVVAQTVLGPGDLAFIGTNSDGATYDQDTFAFVLLKDIDAATQIKFTDRGWNDASGFFDTPGDSQFTWTSGIDRSVGDIIVLDGTNLYPASYSTIGDQIFAYQGLDALPVFIAGLHTNVTPGSTDSNWDGAATSNSTSALPDQLENGLNAMRFTTEYDNGQYSAISAGGNSYASLEEILAKVNNIDNWNFSNTTSYNPPAEPGIEFVLPAPCIAPENAVLSLSANNICPGSSTTINISGNLNDAAEWVIYTDSCGGNEIGRTTGASFEVTPPNGNTTYYVRGEDGTGCVDETIGSCATITVNVEDNTPPSIACPSDIEIDNDAGTTVTYSSPLVTDNCNIPQPAKANFTSLGGFNGKFYYLSNDSFNPEGAFSDAESNGGNVVAINDASENNFVNSSLSTSGLGTVMIGFTDIASEGNFVWRNGEAVSYTNWNTNEPNNSNNEDYTELIISNGKWNDFPNYTRRYILETNQATQTAGLPSGSEFPIGITENTFEITDASGNKSTCSFNVTVNDVEAPMGYTVSIDQAEIDENNQTSISFTFANAEVGTTYNYTFSSDNGGTNATGSGAIASATDQITGIDLSDLEDGDITLSVTLTDASLNEGAEVTDSKLKATNEAPVAVCKSFTAQLDASGNVTISPNDIDGGSSDDKEGFILSISQETFDCSNIGDNTVELTITDSNDLKDTCTAKVTVEDNVAPVALTKDITVQLDENGIATIIPADVDNGSNDACGIADLSLDITEFSCEDVGENTVTLTVTDNNENETTATAKVTVEDNVAPVALTKNITVQLDKNGTATIVPTDVNNGSNDACGIADLSLDITEFSCEDVGGNIVTLTVVDNNQNETTATATVTVEDTIVPIPNIANLEDIVVKCEVFPGRITAPTAKDNCSELTATTSDPLTYNEIGSYVITWSFDDGNGNTTIQKQKVIVEPSPLNAVTFDDASFEYNGDAHSLEVKNLPETASVEYSIVPETGIQNGAIKAGVYTITANLFSGIETCPDAQLTATLTIDKAEAEISADAVQTFVYDGTVKNIVANLNHSETELTYTPQKGFIEPGTYEIMVNSVETENYFATSKEVTLVIEKAEFTGVSFADNTEAFVYNGTEHSIFVSGLPEGATVEYTNNGQTNAGTYLVTAKVSKPGYKDLVLTANMVINKASQSITFDELEDRNQLSD
ncbi:HYR domain-containing protein, partial [uncultured Salegentibacter sp.]|uniref:HYR domain-containing protein n=1 Tax=uncultured Salegentibacter sp. TaxID=259320 RepID=UPI0025999DC0